MADNVIRFPTKGAHTQEAERLEIDAQQPEGYEEYQKMAVQHAQLTAEIGHLVESGKRILQSLLYRRQLSWDVFVGVFNQLVPLQSARNHALETMFSPEKNPLWRPEHGGAKFVRKTHLTSTVASTSVVCLSDEGERDFEKWLGACGDAFIRVHSAWQTAALPSE